MSSDLNLAEVADVACRVAADDRVPLWECPCRECWRLENSAIVLTTDEAETPATTTYPEWLAGFILAPSEVTMKRGQTA